MQRERKKIMAQVTTKIKLRTSLPTGKTTSSSDYYLEEGEVYISGAGTNTLSIYIGATDDQDNLLSIDNIKPIILKKTGNRGYEPATIGGFSNNDSTLSNGTITGGVFNGSSNDMTFNEESIKRLCVDISSVVSSSAPTGDVKRGQIWFKTIS